MSKISPSAGASPLRTEGSSQTGDATPWKDIYEDPAFHALLARKAKFIIPAIAFFTSYYFIMLILAGYAPALMERKIIGNINAAYLFALSQFATGWFLMALYIRRARDFDTDAQIVINTALTNKVIKGNII